MKQIKCWLILKNRETNGSELYFRHKHRYLFLSNTSLNDNALEKLDKISAQGNIYQILPNLNY